MNLSMLTDSSSIRWKKEILQFLSGKRQESLTLLPLPKLIIQMKLIAFLLIVLCVQATASASAQKITLSEKRASIPKLLTEIRKQSDFDFIVNAPRIKETKPLSIRVSSMPLEQVLQLIFANQPVDYLIDNKTIIIRDRVSNSIRNVKDKDQIHQVSGVVMNDKGEVLSGVSVVEKGTNNGVVTDADGRFVIQVKDQNAILQISYVGFKSQEISASSSNINVVLESEGGDLSDVVIVGYGSLKKSDITGAVSSIKGSDLTKLPTGRVDQALQGRAAGVFVLNTDGAPGGQVTIRIRGMNSINGGNNALIVVDGLQGVDLKSINPNDIESMEILKDASATAIYGAQGANGVVLITTKRGKTGKPTIGYNFTYGLQKLAKKLDVMNAADYARKVNEFELAQNGSGRNPSPVFSDAEIANFEKNGGTDWQDVIYRTAPIQNHELSVSGGLENLQYLISGGYLNQKGIMLNSDYERYALRANVNTNITKWLQFGVNWAGTREHMSSAPFGGDNGVGLLATASLIAPRWAPTEPVYDEDGSYHRHSNRHGPSDTWNPLASTIEPFIDNNVNKNALNTSLNFKIWKGLALEITGGAFITNTNNQNYFNRKTYTGMQDDGVGNTYSASYSKFQNSNIITYIKDFGKHSLNITGVAEQQFTKYVFNSINASSFLVDQTGVFNLGGANLVVPASGADERVLNSYMGRLNYGFDDRYLLTLSYRADGSSVFGRNNKWGYFPSGSLAWRVANEPFFENVNFMNELKFRASWGVTGNQAINPYQTLSLMGSGSNYPYNGSNATDLGFYIANPANPNLKWESTTQTNFGVDIGILNDKFTITADYYTKTTRDLLMSRGLPMYTGFSSVIDNVGSVENKGIEVSLGSNISLGKVFWSSNLNFFSNKNTVLDLGGLDKLGYLTTTGGYGINTPFMYLVPGESFGQMYGYHHLGTWSTKEAQEAASYGQLPGDPKYLDLNKDGVIDANDVSVIGNAFPKIVFGWNNTFTYKNFDLAILVQGTQGNKLFNTIRIRMESEWEGTSANLLRRWTEQNQNTEVPAIITQKAREDANLVSKINTGWDERNSRWVEDASYLRVKTIVLGYSFPATMLNKINFKTVRVYASATNMFTLTKYTGYDPEVSSFNGNDAQIGVDFAGYPQPRTVNLGINLSF